MQAKPVIAIVGRPNVGKSTLFNRIAGKQKAIVIDEPGATRDRNYMDCVWHDKAFTLIDTGGFEPTTEERILVQMREQTNLAIEEADVIIFLMDGRDGLTPSDTEIARQLRGRGKKVFYAANKVDGARHEELLTEFYRLGIDELHSISAQHGLGVDELLAVLTDDFPEASESGEDENEPVAVAIVGKPNVGKSSLVNLISGRPRSIANPTPGTTRDAVDTVIKVHGRRYLLIDTAGIRRKNKISLTLEKYSVIQALKSINRCEIALVLIDAEEGMTEQDAKIVGLAYERGKACIIVVNKWDKIEKDNATAGKFVEEIHDKIKFMDFAPIVFISALTGQRAPKIFDLINEVDSQYTKRVDTSPLNDLVKRSLRKNPMPRFQNKAMSISYATQTGVKPPTFVLFVSHARGVHFSYERYLMNAIRSEFGFDKVPIRLIFRKKR
ncbi:MAG TPA: ribosome biogenesis GTPase Der [Smithellaceae bacterium]|jgi:GTP-binding protein|nr:ribosome biogenesis GTPase Der [Syntrophaceae bacterium]HOU56527.1 ribosome biogenesis GTPase Der [Smithellaceae bacterium]MBP9531749.1 ribosome biogenesis GTPase Der [Syntrophaceae bacterium]MBP9650193.1 ribosome biogenesis GTPase Der [Syntrophaceae bacterium]HQH00949.1 ribosome biogenesis GTPase Der [Smithellaceae bacterium]